MGYDIVIIGGGPAGATVARLLGKKYKILLLDRRLFCGDEPKKKCCGGLLAPDAQKVLASQKLGVPQSILTGPQMFSVKTIDFDNNLERYYQRHYINIDRELFDRWLLSLIPDRVEIVNNAIYRSAEEIAGGFEISYRHCGVMKQVETKLLIGADGAASKVRRGYFITEPDRYLSIQNSYETDQLLPHYISIFDQTITDFYSWVIQKGAQLLIGTAIPDGKPAQKLYQQLLKQLKETGFQFGDLIEQQGTLIMRPRNPGQINLAKNGVALAGEAAGLISPSSAEGISYALKSGAFLAKSLNQNLNNFEAVYRKLCRGLKRNIAMKNMKIPVMYTPLLRKAVMKSGVLSMGIES